MNWLFVGSHRRCYCAFCKRPRQVFVKRHLSWTDVVSVALLGSVVTTLLWREMNPKGIMLFVSLLIVAEFVVQLRWRVGLACATCGFDPLLYSRNPDAAAKKVREFYHRRSEQPDFLLTAQNLIETQKRIQTAQHQRERSINISSLSPKNRSPGKSLSRTV